MDYEEKLKGKFSIGLSLDITLEEYKILMDKYGEYINSIYFSLPLGKEFHTRSSIQDEFQKEEKIKAFYEILEYFVMQKVKLDCVFNKNSLSEKKLVEGLSFLKNNLEVDQITCLNQHVDVVDDFFPSVEKIYSFNNNLSPNNISSISEKFDTVVLGKSFLRNYDAIEDVYSNGYDIKLLVNNGCSFNCQGCQTGSKMCEETFKRNLSRNDLNSLYALQSFYPFELEELLKQVNCPIKYIKVSNRTSDFKYLDMCLESYIMLIDPNYYLKNGCINYRLWTRLAHFNRYLKNLDEKEIISQKQKLLEKSKRCI